MWLKLRKQSRSLILLTIPIDPSDQVPTILLNLYLLLKQKSNEENTRAFLEHSKMDSFAAAHHPSCWAEILCRRSQKVSDLCLGWGISSVIG